MRAQALFFLSAMRSADNRTGFVRQSQRVKRLTFYEQDNRSDLGASSEFLREQKEGCNPLALRPGASSIRRIGITCYTSLIIIEKFTFKNTFLWHTKSSGNHLRHGPLHRPSFISNMVFYVFHFLGQKWNSILIHDKGENMAHLEKYSRAQLGHILKHDSRSKDLNGNYIKFGNEEIDTSRTHLNYNLHERKDGLSDYDFVKNRAMEFLAKNVRKREDINWVGSWVITLPESLQGASEAQKRKFFEVCHDFLGKRYGFDNIVGAYVHLDETTPHMHTKITPVFYDEKKNKFRHSAKDMFNRADLKSFHLDLSERMEKEFGFDVGIYENKREDERLPNKSIKELKAENKELADLKKRMLAEAKEQNEEIKRLKREAERERERNELLKQEMAQTSLLEKGKAKLFEKDVDRALELADSLTEKRTEELNKRTAKAELEAFEAKQKEREVIEMNQDWAKGYRQLERTNEALKVKNEALENENRFLHNVIKTMQRAFDVAERFLKGLNIWGRFKQKYRDKDFEQYKEFQSFRHDESLHADNRQNRPRDYERTEI
jgi:hypothetical protein